MLQNTKDTVMKAVSSKSVVAVKSNFSENIITVSTTCSLAFAPIFDVLVL